MAPDSAWRIAIIDSGLDPAAGLTPAACVRFEALEQGVRRSDPRPDEHGHGTRIAQVIASSPRPVSLLIAQALDARGVSSAAAIAAAIEWALANAAQLLHLSVGLSQDRAVLSAAVAKAVTAGVVVVASCPARGALSYPAAYAGVMRATGDARCEEGQISHLAADYAEFGGCVRFPGEERARGASIGAAHVTRFISAHVHAGAAPARVRERLSALASFHGRERR
jgi:hypothetical protein